MIRVAATAISYGRVEELVLATGHGAVVSFYGMVRDRSGELVTDCLEYEAYVPMAERELERIAGEARRQWGVGKVAVLHRTGRLAVGEVSVAIAVGSTHRAEAFAACQYVIDQIKQRVPIWKRDLGPAGARWAGDGDEGQCG